jgi:uncharacterized membrane protein AbrB (regulator of aidB expression)
MLNKFYEKLFEDSWTALFIEFLLFITIASVSAIVCTFLKLPVGVFFGVAFLLGIMVEKIQQKRTYGKINKIVNQIKEESING